MHSFSGQAVLGDHCHRLTKAYIYSCFIRVVLQHSISSGSWCRKSRNNRPRAQPTVNDKNNSSISHHTGSSNRPRHNVHPELDIFYSTTYSQRQVEHRQRRLRADRVIGHNRGKLPRQLAGMLTTRPTTRMRRKWWAHSEERRPSSAPPDRSPGQSRPIPSESKPCRTNVPALPTTLSVCRIRACLPCIFNALVAVYVTVVFRNFANPAAQLTEGR